MRTLVITGIIFFVAQFALGWVILRFRNRGGAVRYTHGNNTLETIWTTATAVLFVGIVLVGTRIWIDVHISQPDPNAIPIELMAKQFAFNFRYPGPDGKFGRTDLKLVNDAAGNPFGLDDKDPSGKDDIVSASLKVPAGKPIKLILHSRDVIHNFFVRELRLKQDIVPGMEIPLYFEADQPGTYEIPCSELCGLGHFQMRSTMQVMAEADFEKWKQEQAANR
ncbi:MAG TPA: cupredoxin domain-containing protein [Bryobacteraceae bacterium]|nr:cupredoxin domain-containing protein [Bryobacteraceae bacterium]